MFPIPRPGRPSRAFKATALLQEVTGRSWVRIYLARPILEAIEERA